MGGAPPIFPPAGPLQHAGDLLHQIRSARAAATASVAEFKQLVSSPEHPADDLLQQQIPQLEVELTNKARTTTQSKPAQRVDQEQRQQQEQTHAELEQALTQLDAARQQLFDLQADRTVVQQHMVGVLACMTELSQQVQAAEKQYSAAQDQLQELNAAVQALECELQQSQEQLQQKQKLLDKAQQHAQEQQLLLQQVQSNLASTQQEKQQLQLAHCEAQAQVQQARLTAATLTQQLGTAQADAAAAGRLLASAADAVVAAHQQLHLVAAIKQELQASLTEAATASESNLQQLSQLSTEVEQLRRRQQHAQLEVHIAKALAAEKTELVQQLEQKLAQAEQQPQCQQLGLPQQEPLLAGVPQADLAATEGHAGQQPQQSCAFPASCLMPLGPLGEPLLRSSTAGKSEQELMQSYAGLMQAVRRVGAPAVRVHDPFPPTIPADCAGNAVSSGPVQRASWLHTEAAADGAPPIGLLAELQQESDELTEQLTKLQQYLKTSTSSCADLNTVEVMDEGLSALRRLTHEVVGVATSTVQRVTTGGGANSAPTSTAGRLPSLLGGLPQQASCAGVCAPDNEPGQPMAASSPAAAAAELAAAEAAGLAASSAGRQAPATVAVRRLGLELPRLQSWGSAAAIPESPKQLPEPAAADGQVGSAQDAQDPAAAAALLSMGVRLDHWGSELSEAACTWLAGDLQVEEELGQSFPGSPASPLGTGVAPGARVAGSRLAVVSALDAWGSGMLPVSGAGSAVQEQQQEVQQRGLLGPPAEARSSSSPGLLQAQLDTALAEVRQLQGERLLLRSQVAQLAEMAARQEDHLAVNNELLTALTTRLLSDAEDASLSPV